MLRVLQSDALPPFTGGRRAGTQAGTRTGTRQCGRASRGRWAASSIRARRRLMHRGAGEGPGQRRTAHVVACPGGPGCECWTSTPPPRRLQPNLPLRAANRADGFFGSHRLREEAGDSPWVLASPLDRKRRIEPKAVVRALSRLQTGDRLALGSRLTVQDLRRTWRTFAMDLGVD